MKKELSVMLLGLGFSKLSERRRRILHRLFFTSLAVHAIALLVFGSLVVMRSHREEETVFVSPPPIKRYEPRKLEHRVKVQKKQRSSSRPAMMPRMIALKTSSLALPEIKVEAKVIQTSFQPKFKAVTGVGLGAGLGTGFGLSGFSTGVSRFNFFGIQGRGNRIAVLVDVSVSMVEDERGGPEGFSRVKFRIGEVVNALHDATLFNVVAFADAATTWQPKLAIGSDDNKGLAQQFLSPFNSGGNYGLSSGNVAASDAGVPAVAGTTRLDLALTAAFEQGADTILIISDGLPKVEKPVPPGVMKAYQEMVDKWHQDNADAVRHWDENARTVQQRVWVGGGGGGGGGLKEGQPIPSGGGGGGHWETVSVVVGPGPRPTPPGPPSRQHWTFQDFVTHLELLHKKFYEEKGRKPPVIHCIGYQIDKPGGKFLRDLGRAYKGKYRRVARVR